MADVESEASGWRRTIQVDADRRLIVGCKTEEEDVCSLLGGGRGYLSPFCLHSRSDAFGCGYMVGSGVACAMGVGVHALTFGLSKRGRGQT